MKKALARLLILLSILSCPCFSLASSHIFCDCGQENCICFIQLGDEGPFVSGVIHRLKEQGYCSPKQTVGQFDQGVLAGVLQFQAAHNLPQTGMLDDETLTLLLFGQLPHELDESMPDSDPSCAWVPTDGGQKRHSTLSCSSMLDPRKVSVRNADALSFAACEHCNPPKEMPESTELPEQAK